ncbi:MAG TPA: AAA family ATPase [Jiangellales bacterium]|nr:AAA family ATPase [Jiangellales bacterium]
MVSSHELAPPSPVRPQAAAPPADVLAKPLPGLARGTRLLGEYEGSGFTDGRFLVSREDGQVLHLSRLLYLVAVALDGRRDAYAVADRVSAQLRRRLPPEGVLFLVSAKLAPLGILAAADGRQAPPPRADPVLVLRLRRVLVPRTVVSLLGDIFAPLFLTPLVVAVLGALAVLDVMTMTTGAATEGALQVVQSPGLLLLLLAGAVASTLFHEIGHAAACRFGGGRPGAIGMGVYLVFPAFYTDVTDAYRLDRRSRIRTDLGGIYFNAVTAVGLLLAYHATGFAPLVTLAFLVHLEALQQLLPVIRLDGYYLLGDLVGVPDLFGRVRPVLASLVPGRPVDPRVAELRTRTRRLVTAWVLVVVPLLAASLVLLVVRLPELGRRAAASATSYASATVTAVSQGDVVAVLLNAVSVVLVVVPFLGLTALTVVLARRLVRLLGAGRRTVPVPRPRLEEAPMDTSAPVSSPTPNGVRPLDSPVAPGTATPSHPEPEPAAARRGGGGPAAPSSTATVFTDDTMLRPRSRPPARGWRRGLYRATGGAVNVGPSRAEQDEHALAARIQAPVQGCRRVAVLSRKGGAGKTTTTLMLGHTFASLRGDRVVALDANPDAGSLAHRVRRETTETVTSLLGDRSLIDRYSDIRAYTSQSSTRLEVIASDDDPRITQALGEADYSAAVDVLDRHYNLILLDTGTGILDSAIQGVLREADQIVVVMPPALDGARAAASTLDWLEEHGHDRLAAGAVAVVNQARKGGLVELERIEQHFAQRCAAVVRIPWDPALAAGARTGLEELRTPTRQAYLSLAAAVADGFQDDGGRR